MVHIRRMSDMLNEKFDKYNQNISFRHCAEDGDFGVRIAKAEGNTEYKAGENVDYLADFVNACKGMAETCNGSLEVSMDSNFEYNVYIADENDNMYASINFMLVYFNEENLEPIEELFDKNYLNEGRNFNESAETSEKYTLEHPYVVNLPRGDYYIWESFDGFEGTADIENARARISDARRIQDFHKSQGFKTIQDVAEYVIKYFK